MRGGQIRLRPTHRLDHVEARQQRGDRGRQRAAGAVRVARVDPLAGQFGDRLAVEQQIGAVRRRQDARPSATPIAGRADAASRTACRMSASVAGAGPPISTARLRQVRRDHPRQRHERVAQRRDRIFAQQPMAALRHHHRIEHDVARTVMAQPVGDRRRNLARSPPCRSSPRPPARQRRSRRSARRRMPDRPSGTSARPACSARSAR